MNLDQYLPVLLFILVGTGVGIAPQAMGWMIAAGIQHYIRVGGAQLVFRRTDKNSMAVNIVTLDDPSAIEPTLHIWTQSRIPWFDTTDSHERREKSHS